MVKAQMVKDLSATQESQVWSLGQEDPLEEGMETHSSVLAWRIPWTQEPGGLQSMRSQRRGHDWATNTSTTHWCFWLPWKLSWYRIRMECRRPQFDSWVGKICWRRDRLPTPVFLGFPCSSADKESAHNVGDLSLIPWRREQPSPVFWPGKLHRLYSPRGG